ncbi:MAG: helix-turn-helix transcriptional regulator [Oscillibacter sp.]|jgi:transcriptional regulator with XRE-family HTH domain|nr:helix-turn-helix transcriptional regulator [uncultured Oscillibacter sp.]MCI8970997.1 helix-turn-helix transcriptional regulator [Oscillibacter sp.]MCI9578202.1 helix-turn-helix transcriptional regulator [Oscillibacter sp.]
MYKNRAPSGRHNLCGSWVAALRKAKVPRLSQRGLADLLQLGGLDVDKNAVQRIESGQRFVTDIELKALAQALGVAVEDLLET